MFSIALPLISAVLASATPNVAVLPLEAGEGVASIEARGIEAMLRDEGEKAEGLDLEPVHRKDKKAAKTCGTDAGCLGAVAEQRGVDLIAGGTIEPHPEGFQLHVVVVEKGGDAFKREVSAAVVGNEQQQRLALYNLLRRAFIPQDLKGRLLLKGGVPGARISLDGEKVGEMPQDEPLMDIPEGEHDLKVALKGYLTWERRITITDGETTTVKVRMASRMADDPKLAETSSGFPILPVVLGGAALAVTVTGAGLGYASLQAGQEAEKRAAQQLLTFPRDRALLEQGELYALLANLNYGIAVALGGGAVLTYFLMPPGEGADEEEK